MENTYLGLLKLQEKYRENNKILQYLQIIKLSKKNKSFMKEIYPNSKYLLHEAKTVIKKKYKNIESEDKIMKLIKKYNKIIKNIGENINKNKVSKYAPEVYSY